jgi:hypothetical protein
MAEYGQAEFFCLTRGCAGVPAYTSPRDLAVPPASGRVSRPCHFAGQIPGLAQALTIWPLRKAVDSR